MMNNEDNPKFWENIYKNDEAGWDLGGPTPVFVRISSIITPKKICIIGCGRGYDAVMFAKNNFDVTAVDFAPTAVKSLKSLAKKNNVTINVLEKDIFTKTGVGPQRSQPASLFLYIFSQKLGLSSLFIII